MPRYGRRILLVTAAIVALAAVMSLARRIDTVQRLQKDVNLLSTQAAKEAATAAYLQTQIAKATAGTDEDEELRGAGYARPGDQIIHPIPVEVATPAPKNAPTQAATPPPTPPPQDVWWRLFFGDNQ